MFHLTHKLPTNITVAFSGGVDSVAAVDFLMKRHNVCCAFFDHGTQNSALAKEFVVDFCSRRDLPLIIGTLCAEKPKEHSSEEFWRNERYRFLEDIAEPVITAHHLDDCVETYLFGCFHGQPKVIPSVRNNIIRPFLTTSKSQFIDWCERKGLSWCEDSSNRDTKYMRNFIRAEVVPLAKTVNPGIYKVVRKIVLKRIAESAAVVV